MLSIEFIGQDGVVKSGEWHTGESFEWIQKCNNDIISLQADGDELVHIVRKFHMPLPLINKVKSSTGIAPVQRWYGDWAKMVAYAITSPF